MPVILTSENFTTWLDPNNQNTDQLKKLLLPYQHEDLVMYSVSKKLNGPTNNYVDLIANEQNS